MNRTQQIQRWRRYRRAKGGLHIGRWIVGIGVGILAFNLFIAFSFIFLSVGSAAGLYSAYTQNLPDPTSIQTEQASYETVKIYDRTGKHLLYESIDPRPARGDRTYLKIAEIPQMVRDATIALEDRSFYTNIGVNPRGLGRAFLSNLRGGSVQGASSITQQLVKNVLIDPKERYEQSYARKIKEAIMAIEITRKYPGREGKNQILEWYLNYNFYGNAAYGIEAAANVYYDKPVKDLTLDEIAVLAAIPQYPGLNPFQSPADAYRRQRKVLVSMVEAGYLTQEQADAATRYFNTPLLNDLAEQGLLSEGDLPLVATGDRPATARALNALVKADLITQEEADAAKKLPGPLWQYTRESAQERYEIPPDAPHFAILVLQQLQEKYNTPEDPYFIWENGLKVYTTLDWDLQTYAECVARSHIASLRLQTPKPCQNDLAPLPAVPEALKQKFDHEVTNASIVAIRPNTGEVLTMVGSLDYFDDAIDGQVNVSLASRQPGSSFKPYTYLTAFESGAFAPSSMVMDVRTVFPDPGNPPYVPENYDRKYHGPQTLRQALQRSYNIPAVWLMDQVGVANVIKTARRLGVSSLNNELNSYGLSLTLGGGEVALLDHTYAFSVLANGGVMAGQPVPADLQRPGYRKLDPVTILKVEDKDSKVLEQYTSPTVERVVDPAPAYLIDNVLSDPSPARGRVRLLCAIPDAAEPARRGQDRHDQLVAGRLDDGLHAAVGRGRVDGQQRQQADEAGRRLDHRRADLQQGAGQGCRGFAGPGLARAARHHEGARVLALRPAAHARLPADHHRQLSDRPRPHAARQHVGSRRDQRDQRQAGLSMHAARPDQAPGLPGLPGQLGRLGAREGSAPAADRGGWPLRRRRARRRRGDRQPDHRRARQGRGADHGQCPRRRLPRLQARGRARAGAQPVAAHRGRARRADQQWRPGELGHGRFRWPLHAAPVGDGKQRQRVDVRCAAGGGQRAAQGQHRPSGQRPALQDGRR